MVCIFSLMLPLIATTFAKLKAVAKVGMLAGKALKVLNLKMGGLVIKMTEAKAMAVGALQNRLEWWQHLN